MRHFKTKDEISVSDSEATIQFALRRNAMRLVGLSPFWPLFHYWGRRQKVLPLCALASGHCCLMSSVPLLTGALPSSERVDCLHSKRTYRSTGENLQTAGEQAMDPP